MSLENLFRTNTHSIKQRKNHQMWVVQKLEGKEKMTGNIQEGESARITGEYISGNDSVPLCKLSPFFCLFIKIISEVNLLL